MFTRIVEPLDYNGNMRWKIILSLLPFVFPLIQIFAEVDIKYDILPAEPYWPSDAVLFVLGLEHFVAAPFGPFLQSLPGFWSNNSLVALPNGPLLPGSFAVAIFYSVVIYIVLSLISKFWQSKRE